MLRRQAQAGSVIILPPVIIAEIQIDLSRIGFAEDRPHHVAAIVDADQGIDPRHVRQKPFAVALDETARHDDSSATTGLLVRDCLGNGFVGLGPRSLQKAAGIDYDGIGVVWIGGDGAVILGQFAEHLLGIDQVLGTTQTDKCDACLFSHTCSYCTREHDMLWYLFGI